MCVVVVAKNASHTAPRPIVSTDIQWDEHFVIEYKHSDEDSIILIQVYEKGENDLLLGESKIKLKDIKPPADDKHQDKDKENTDVPLSIQSWEETEHKNFPLIDLNQTEVGVMAMRIKREYKLYGTIKLNIKSVSVLQTVGAMRMGKCIVKLGEQCFSTPIADANPQGENYFLEYNLNAIDLEVDDTNNIFDVFIEFWQDDDLIKKKPGPIQNQGEITSTFVKDHIQDEKVVERTPVQGSLIGHSRFTIDDAKNNFNSKIFIFDKEHHQKIGFLCLQAQLEQNKKK